MFVKKMYKKRRGKNYFSIIYMLQTIGSFITVYIVIRLRQKKNDLKEEKDEKKKKRAAPVILAVPAAGKAAAGAAAAVFGAKVVDNLIEEPAEKVTKAIENTFQKLKFW